MTVIVYRDGVLAADRQSTISGMRACEVTKIARRNTDGALIGMAGDAGLAAAFFRWFLAGEQGDRPAMHMSADGQKTAIALVIRPSGVAEEHSCSGWSVIEGPFFAYGSGMESALAAMHMGADAQRAAEIANLVTTGCGMGVDVVRREGLSGVQDALDRAAAHVREHGPGDGRFTLATPE